VTRKFAMIKKQMPKAKRQELSDDSSFKTDSTHGPHINVGQLVPLEYTSLKCMIEQNGTLISSKPLSTGFVSNASKRKQKVYSQSLSIKNKPVVSRASIQNKATAVSSSRPQRPALRIEEGHARYNSEGTGFGQQNVPESPVLHDLQVNIEIPQLL
jgi:hypothetical protein